MDRFSRRCRLADHIHRIAGDQDGVGMRQIAQIGIVARAIPENGLRIGERPGQAALDFGDGAVRRARRGGNGQSVAVAAG